MKKRLVSIFTIGASFLILELLSLLKMNVLFGSKTAIFSGFSLGGPLVGLYTGMGLGAGLFALRRMVHCFMIGTSLFSPFSLYLPTIAAGWYFKSTSWRIRVALPLLCMALFIAHPVGGQAWFYSLYWLVPVLFFVLPVRSSFTEALGATFVQHAVGSVLWIYVMPTTALLWTSLMPIVAIERLVCALGMVVVMRAITYAQTIRCEKNSILQKLYAKIVRYV